MKKIVSEVGSIVKETMKASNEEKIKYQEYFLEAGKCYREKIGIERYGDICDLYQLNANVSNYFENDDKNSKEELEIILELLEKVNVDYDDLHPYEVPAIFDFKTLKKKLKKQLDDDK